MVVFIRISASSGGHKTSADLATREGGGRQKNLNFTMKTYLTKDGAGRGRTFLMHAFSHFTYCVHLCMNVGVFDVNFVMLFLPASPN